MSDENDIPKIQRLPFLTCEQRSRYQSLIQHAFKYFLMALAAIVVVSVVYKVVTSDKQVDFCFIETSNHVSSIPGVPDTRSFTLYGHRDWWSDAKLMERELDHKKVIKFAKKLKCDLK